MPSANRCVTFVVLCELALAGCAHKPPDLSIIRAQNDREIQSLLDLPTPDHLAAASFLELRLERDAKTDPSMKLIEQAEALAPRRPELVWLQLAHCRRLNCDARIQIEDHLKTLDPENGFVWIPDLERAQASGSHGCGRTIREPREQRCGCDWFPGRHGNSAPAADVASMPA